jgi:hypothetical protein
MRSATVLLLLGLTSAGLGFAASVAPARAGDPCEDLWVERNSIYKAYGYCFKTQRAINYFGNSGCIYDSEGAIPMSGADRATVLDIKHREKAQGCL